MLFGASTFIWTSPFSNQTLSLIDRAKAIGFDIIEICVEDPDTIDPSSILARLRQTDLKATVCGAFGPDRDLSSDDGGVRENGLAYLRRCVEIAEALGSRTVVGPMYSAVGKTRMLEAPERAKQWGLAVESLRRAADFAADRGVTLGLEPLNRFETDLVNTVDQGVRMIRDIDRRNVGLLLDTFHMNIEEKDIPAALRRADGHIVEFHACSSDRGTPGEDHLPWPEIVAALRDVDYRGPRRDRGVHAEHQGNRESRRALAPSGGERGRARGERPQASAGGVRRRRDPRRGRRRSLDVVKRFLNSTPITRWSAKAFEPPFPSWPGSSRPSTPRLFQAIRRQSGGGTTWKTETSPVMTVLPLLSAEALNPR